MNNGKAKNTRSDLLLNEVEKLAQIGAWEFNFTTNELYYTKELYRILEAEKEFTPTIEKAIQFYIPQHRPIIRNAIQRIIDKGEAFNLELKIRTLSGNYKWVKVIGRAVLENNVTKGVLGTFQDIDSIVEEKKMLDTIVKTSTALINADINSFNYKTLTSTMNDISGAAFSILNIFADNYSHFTTYAISGNKHEIKKAESQLGFSFKNHRWEYDQKRESISKNNCITRLNSLLSLTGDVIPEAVIRNIEKEFNLGEVCLIKLYRSSVLIGDFTMLFHKNTSLKNEQLAELFANQAALVIEKLRTENSLLQNELKQKHMISGISEVIAIINPNKIIEYISPNIHRNFGWYNSDILHKNFESFIHPLYLDLLNKEFVKTIEKTDDDTPVEFELRCKNGHYKPVELTATSFIDDPVIQGILINFRDITKRRNIEKEAIQLRQAVVHSSAAIIITDTNANIEYTNPKFSERTGYSAEEVFGKNPRIIQSGQTPIEVYKDLWATIMRGHEWRGELLNKTKQGKLFWEMTSISSIKDRTGKITHFVAVKENITGQKAQHEAIKEKNKMLEQINAEKDKFFSIIAHDLRSPFNSLLGLTEVMTAQLKSMTLEQIQQLAQSLNDSASNLYDLISNLLEWATLQRGRTIFEPVEVSISETIDTCCNTLIDVARQKNVSIEFDYDKNIRVWADRNMLKTILRNLVSNAIKFSPRGSKITLKVEKKNEGKIQFSIRDQGIGMSKKLLGDLFKIDKKTNRQGTDNEPSTGLGLLLCKDLIEKHKGELWAESIEGKGSTFYFVLPRKIE